MNQAFSLKLSPYKSLQEILQVTAEVTRTILKCDRVLAYSADNILQPEVIAESVDSMHLSLIGKRIKDPFLEGDRLEMYCYGMSLTIDDINTLDDDKKKLEDLEKLNVKSVAIAPIAIDNQLLAFLVAHKSSSQPWDMEVASLIAQQARNAETAILQGVRGEEFPNLPLARQITEITKNQICPVTKKDQPIKIKKVLTTEETQPPIEKTDRETKAEQVLIAAVNETVELLKCDRAIICSLDKVGNSVVIAESVKNGCSKALGKNIDNNGFTFKHLREYRQGAVWVWRSPHEAKDRDTSSYHLEQLKNLNVQAGIVAPITKNGQLSGLLIAHQCSAPRNWQPSEINSMNQIANNLTNMFEYINISNDNKQEELDDLQKQLEKEKMWTKHLAQLIQQIRKSLNKEHILETGVRKVHKILKCDRVVLYALNQDSYGEIIAESVSDGWIKGKGKIIKDPCFEARYLDKYRDGRFRAWNNIYLSGMSECYIEQLEKLEVKANVVVPVIKEDQLFGLLVVHQCSDTRQWQQSEILWLTQVASQIGFALDNAQILADAQKLRQHVEQEKIWTEHFTDAVQQIRQSLKTQDVCRASVREARRVLMCDRVVVYGLNQDSYGEIIAESVGHGWTKSEGKVIKDPCFEARYLDSYRDGRVRAWSNIYEAQMSGCYIEQLEKLEVKANLVTPITNQGKLFGLLVAHQCSDTRQWQQPEINWLAQIAQQTGSALENARMLEQIEKNTKETQDILARTLNSSFQIKTTVQNVTAGLVNLSNSSQKFGETIYKIKDVSKQLAQQSLNMTRTLNLSQAEAIDQNDITKQSDAVFGLMQALFEATGMIEPLFDHIKTEITEKTAILQSETHNLFEGAENFEAANQKLDCVAALNHQMSDFLNVSYSLENQIQNTNFTQDSVQELATITERISHQSVMVINSFNQLALLYL